MPPTTRDQVPFKVCYFIDQTRLFNTPLLFTHAALAANMPWVLDDFLKYVFNIYVDIYQV